MMKRRYFAIAAGAAVAVFTAFGAAGASALWTAKDTVAVTANAGTIGLTVSGTDSLTATFDSTHLTALGSITITNSGTVPDTAFTTQTVVPVSGAAHDLAAGASVTIWSRTGTSCPTTPPPSGTYSGTWAAMPSWLDNQGALAPGAAVTYCVLTSVTSATVTSTGGAILAPTLIVSASNHSWSSGSQSGAVFSLASVNPATVTAVQAAIQTTDSSTSVTQVAILTGGNTTSAGSDIDNSSGTIVSPYNFCPTITVTVPSGVTNHQWSLQIDTTKPPYNYTTASNPLTDSSFQGNPGYDPTTGLPSSSAQGYPQTAHIQSVSNGVYTIVGAAAVGSYPVNSYDTHPALLRNLTLSSGQTTTVVFCLSVNKDAPVYPASSGTYSVGQVHFSSCSADNTTPASLGNPNSQLYDFCLYETADGLYPHFYVGYQYSYDWTALVAAAYPGQLSSSFRDQLLAEQTQAWTAGQTYLLNGTSGTGGATTTVTECGPSPLTACTDSAQQNNHIWFTVTKTGRAPDNGGLTNGQHNVLKSNLSSH